MNRNNLQQKSGFILIGAILLLTLGLSAVCLLISAQNHHKLWRLRLERNQEIRSQHNRLTRITHQIMNRLMREPLPETELLQRNEHWSAILDDYVDTDSGTFSIEAEYLPINADPFEPLRMNIDLFISIQDHVPGMAHLALLRGLFCSGRFPIGTVPFLTADGSQPVVPFGSSFSRITFSDSTTAFTRSANSESENWIDPLPLLSIPLGIPISSLDWAAISGLLGLDMNCPIEMGVYPIISENNLKALVVIGTIDQMILSQTETEQKIEFIQGETSTLFSYGFDPQFSSLSGHELPLESRFFENIVVFGNIQSLEQNGIDGLAWFCSLYIYADGAIRISTPLTAAISPNDHERKGSITLIASRTENAPSSLPSGIFIDLKGKVELDAHLISTGVIRTTGELILNGSLCAAAFEGAFPKIIHQKPEREMPAGPDIRFFNNLHFLGIEEIFDDAE